MRVVCIGSSTKDIFFPTSEGRVVDTPEDVTAQQKIFFELGAKYSIEKRYEAIGGCAANVACGLARLGFETSCYSVTGDDLVGKWIRQGLSKEGVNVDLIRTEENCPSDLSAIVVDENSADRVIFSNQKANEKLKINSGQIGNPEWIFIGDLNGEWQKILDDILSVAKEKSIRIAFNPKQKTIHDSTVKIAEAIAACEVVFLNKDEAIELVLGQQKDIDDKKVNDELFLLCQLKSMGVKVAVITDGLRGAWASNEAKKFHAEALVVNSCDTTGAGDSFSSGFLAAYILGKDLEECLKWGIANGGNVVSFYGAIEGLLKKEEITEKSKGVKITSLE